MVSAGKYQSRLAQRTLAEALKETSRRCSGVVLEEHGLLLVAGNHPRPVFVNSALRTGTMDASEVLSRAEAFFGKRGHRYEIWTRDGADADLEKAALAAGMRLAGVQHRSSWGYKLHIQRRSERCQPHWND
jgi:hypothetical protein